METLDPPARSFQPLPSLPRRRCPHLDSATYCTLVRIFSLCLNENRPEEDPSPSSEPTSKAPIFDRNDSRNPKSDDGSDQDLVLAEEFGKDANFDRNGCGNPSSDGSSDQNLALAEEFANNSTFDRNGSGNPSLDGSSGQNLVLEEELEPGEAPSEVLFPEKPQLQECRVQEGLATTTPKLDSLHLENFASVEELEIDDELLNSDLLVDLMSDCAKLIDAPVDVFSSDKGLQDSDHRISHSNPDLRKETKQEGEISEVNRECLTGESDQDMVVNVYTTVTTQDGSSEFKKETSGGMQNKVRACSDPLTDCLQPSNLGEDNSSRSVDLGNDEEIEEGEIPGEIQDIDESLDMVHEHVDFNVENANQRSLHEGFIGNGNLNDPSTASSIIKPIDGLISTSDNNSIKEEFSSMIYDSKQGVQGATGVDKCLKPQKDRICIEGTKLDATGSAVVPFTLGSLQENSDGTAKNIEIPADTKNVEVPVKRKRGALTENGKATKKKAKKRKRAEKDREQGVKRLRLQPIQKPKEVMYCNFYLNGKCNKGEACTYSHDIIPLTKSQPCSHFARDSCLRGDDCAYDHELSKYPCHKLAKGMCSRGDRCKFSHKLPMTESSSPPVIITEAYLSSSLGKSHLIKQLSNRNSTPQGSNDPSKTIASRTQVSMHKPLEGNLVHPLKEPARIPNGMRFLSFGKGKGPAESAVKHGDNFHLETNGGSKICTLQNQEKLVDGHKNVLHLSSRSLPERRSEKHMMSCYKNDLSHKESKISSFSSGPAVTRSFQSEVSEASKLLEEFLFCGSS